MYNIFKQHRRWRLMTAILSLSLLTVMAGAAVAPALNLIQEYFADTDRQLVQMIISLPALFIALTNFIFPAMTKRIRARSLLLIGLILYTVGGCIAGIFSNIYLVLVCRAVVGVGVGIIMPLSTGLISFYFTRDKQTRLMGYSSALNMMGGVVATLVAGLFALVSWRLSFLVYLMGLISVLLCLIWMPNEKIYSEKKKDGQKKETAAYIPFIVSMFLLMFTFFIYPADFAIETAKEGIIPQGYIAAIMAMMDLFGFAGGIAFAAIMSRLKNLTRFVAPLMFLCAYLLLAMVGGWTGVLIGSALAGFANGAGVPYIINTAASKAGANAATTIIPLLSAALYAAQFFTPMILTLVDRLVVGMDVSAYHVAIASSILLLISSVFTLNRAKKK